MDDVISDLGYLSLGTRLKRIAERLKAQTADALAQQDLNLPPSLCPLLETIARLGPVSVGQLAISLEVSQPGITRSLGLLEMRGLITTVPSPEDQRQKRIGLSLAGQDLVNQARTTLWPLIEQAVRELTLSSKDDFLERLKDLEDGLSKTTMAERIAQLRQGKEA